MKCNHDSSRKTIGFGLKPGKWLIFNSPALKGGAINMRDNQGFSHIYEIYGTFLDLTQSYNYKYYGFLAAVCSFLVL